MIDDDVMQLNYYMFKLERYDIMTMMAYNDYVECWDHGEAMIMQVWRWFLLCDLYYMTINYVSH